MRRILLSCLVLIFLISFVSSQGEQDLREVERGQCIRLVQLCNCTMSNITSVTYMKNSTQLLSQVSMTKIGIEFNYSFCNTNSLGNYQVNGFSDPDGATNFPWSYTFEVTPNGYTQTTSQGLTSSFVLFAVLITGALCLIFGFKLIDNETLWFFGIFIIFLGVGMLMYSMSFSFIYIRDLAYTSGTSSLQEKTMRTFFRGVQVIGLFFLPVVMYYGYNVYKGRKKNKESNDGWDNGEY